jgi:D-alanyl-D-alanine carboxypeptidase/D-alanyl-D-alanine-endopeptidase (penicillin-binding protein 4)
MRLRRCLAVLGAGLVAAGSAAAEPATLGSSARHLAGRAAYSCAPKHYRVRPGDTLFSIARRFHTSVHALAVANSIDPAGLLPAGKLLVIPQARCESDRAVPSAPSHGQSALVTSLKRAVHVPGVPRTKTGVVVVDLHSSTVIFSLNPETPLEPASTEKLPLATVALQRLGGGFRTRTLVLGQGTRAGRTWRGNLILQGHGDPALTSAGLRALARAVHTRGITTVTGGVVGDESYFDSARTAPGWKASFAKDESPLLSALVVDRGILDGHAVDHPALAAAILFTRALRSAGVSVSRDPTVGAAGSKAVELTRRASPPLAVLLAKMDTWSDNFIAEMLLKELGARLAGRGSTEAGASLVLSTLAKDDVPLAGVRLADGSGLSGLDRLTARALAAILETIWHEPDLRPLLGTFAVAGSTGTLRHRLLDVPGHELVRGKTGTTDDSSALAGFVGSRFAFAVLNNGSPVNWQAAHLLQDRVAEALLAAVA